jgi:hypothetical protein
LVPAHIVVAEEETATEGVTEGLTVIVIGEEVAVVGDAQLSLEVISTVTTSPSFNPVLENVDPVPTLELFTFHWYAGVPPWVGVAVKTTLSPEHIVVEVGETDTLGVSVEFTVMVIGDDVAVVGEAQVSVEVISTVTTSPSFKPVLENVDPVPALDAFTFH